MSTFNILHRPLVTEKTASLDESKVVFRVDLNANKHQIRDAIEAAFDVKVVKVNTSVVAGKAKRWGRNMGKRSNWKKAVITLREGDEINFYGEEEGEL